MSFNFEDVQEDQSFGASVAYKAYIEPWAKVFGFEYDDDFEPKESEPSIPQSQEGIYRTATTEKFTQPKPKKSEFSFAYNEEEAAELVKNYLSYS